MSTRENKLRAVNALQHTLMELERNILQSQAHQPAMSSIAVNPQLPATQAMVGKAVELMVEAARMLDTAITIESVGLQGGKVEVASEASGTVPGK